MATKKAVRRDFFGNRFTDLRVGRICVRVFDRLGAPSLRPYFNRDYCLASFGVWRVGVQIMRTMTAAEIRSFNARASN